MQLKSQILFGFFIIGIIIAIIFDFFRTYRSLKRVSSMKVIIQDIIYFFVSTFIILWGIINILDSSIRLYIFIPIILGSALHFTFFSKYSQKVYKFLFKTSKEIIDFFLLPLNLILYIILKNCIILKKIVKKCCKKFFNMLTFIIDKLKITKISLKVKKTKEGINYEKSS